MEKILTVRYGKGIYTTSLIVAEVFEKEHYHVTRAIENFLEKLEIASHNEGVPVVLSDELSTQNPSKIYFNSVEVIESFYKDDANRLQKMYYLNLQAFFLLEIGFTGQKAMNTKIKFLKAFDSINFIN